MMLFKHGYRRGRGTLYSGEIDRAAMVKDILLNILVLACVLGVSALFTHWFARKMYNRCAMCGILNAKRRSNCRGLRRLDWEEAV